MKLLRHPMRAIREPFGKAGLIVAIVALVAATVGGAYAATGGQPLASSSAKHHTKKSSAGLNGKQKKEVEKIAKKSGKPGPEGKQGPAGAEGKPGATGPAGANGTDGTNGEKGEKGDTGATGNQGEPGASVEAFPVAAGETACAGNGGVVYQVEASATEICNGSPWTVGGTLPKGATETGTWLAEGSSADTEGVYAAISFPIALKTTIKAENVIYVKLLETNAECTGNTITPKAPEGKLCLYQSMMVPSTEAGPVATFAGASGVYGTGSVTKAGGLLKFTNITDGFRSAGTWAYTGN